MTAELFFFANFEISTEASVCPALTSTPPSYAIIGKTCTGETISFLSTFFSRNLECIKSILDSQGI